VPTEPKPTPQEERRRRAKERNAFRHVRNADRAYSAQLRQVARHVGNLVAAFNAKDPKQVNRLVELLRRYSEILTPWAHATAGRLLADVSKRDETAWRRYGAELGQELSAQLRTAPVGVELARLLDQQVTLITSLPLEAAQRVQRLATAALTDPTRWTVLAAEIMRTGDITVSRANTIARTETSRAASSLLQVRALHLNSEGFIWRNSGDADVRPAIGTKNFAALNTLAKGSHRKLEGTFHRWDEPPIAAPNGTRALPGCIFNCRCWAEPVLPKEITG
jgi:uncharacterized protein with gpF-like domain